MKKGPGHHPEADQCRRPYGFRKSLEVLNDAMTVTIYAETVTKLKKVGLRMVGSCPSHDHEDPSPSFTVYPESNSWYCFGCSRGGDLLDLFMFVEDWAEDAYGPALAAMAQKLDVELPQRSQRWFDRQDDKGRVREAAKRYVADRYQRRLTRVFAPLVLLGEETPEEDTRSS